MQQWKNGSDRLLGSRVTERNASRTRNASLRENTNVFMLLRYRKCLCILLCYVKLTRVLVKRQLESQQRQLEKTGVVKAGLTLCLETERQPYTDWELVKLPFFKTHALAVHSNMFPYFTDWPVSSNL